jgi:hypothetical protein
MATDIAIAVAMSLTHSQIDTVQFQLAQLLHCRKTEGAPLEAEAHGATRFTVADIVARWANSQSREPAASHREQ